MAYKTDQQGKILEQYVRFVDTVSSDPTKDTNNMIDCIGIMEEQGVNVSRLLTASIGLSGEVGEFNDIVKKVLFQGKEVDEDTIRHLRSELGDICWYMAQACMALNTSFEEVIDMNIAKLSDRYPGGFDALRSASRKEGDI
jgi:NTP pyrophosphatase (non-canonical NTP hydrolase)|tara:strand:+ start:117 stop:539 length:423 start_codon:yes stop_codon:yes gene_type:complete